MDEVAGPDLIYGDLCAHRAGTLFAPDEKVVKEGDAGPGGSPAVLAVVVPAEGGGVVHYPGAGIEALGGEIGAVAPKGVEVVKIRVPVVGPAVGVGHRRFPAIGAQRHNRTSFFPCYADAPEGVTDFL